MTQRSKTTTRSMTDGPITRQIILFSLPLMAGNAFQMLYNMVDSVVLGQFVSKQALAAVSSTTMIVNLFVFFFSGFATGATVLIGRLFGARDMKNLHRAVETSMAMTFICCGVFTLLGLLLVRPMLAMMQTPADVMDDAATYLTIYMAGISGLLIYNIGSGILRAVGDSKRPLIFLALTSVLNIVLDLLFVLSFGMKIEGVALATVISQFVSALLTMTLLTETTDIYRFVWKDLALDRAYLRDIIRVGLPAAAQSTVTAFSNAFVQSYINHFGSDCMAGWGSYNKLDQFIMLPMQSMAIAATTFVSQNMGAKKERRAHIGTWASIGMTFCITAVIAAVLVIFAEPAVSLFNRDPEVIRFGALFMHTNTFFLMANCVNHVLAGSLRGRGDSVGPMAIMLISFVGIRQVYLFVLTRWIVNEAKWVGFGYPIGWMSCMVLELAYYYLRVVRRQRPAAD